jgi:hypothetical protein
VLVFKKVLDEKSVLALHNPEGLIELPEQKSFVLDGHPPGIGFIDEIVHVDDNIGIIEVPGPRVGR